jgi:peptidoglycan/LPS O-acetylase OafA/YrhL
MNRVFYLVMRFFFQNLHQTLETPKRQQGIDVLRGIAGLFVVLVHYHQIVPFLHQFSGLSTNLFLLLSGYLVSLPLTRDFLAAQENLSFRNFFIKRLFKIIPSYYIFLIIGHFFVLWQVAPIAPDLVVQDKEWFSYFLFYRNYGSPPARAFEHIWSVCVEEHFYTALPFFYMFLHFLCKKKTEYKKKGMLFLILGIIFLGICFKFGAYLTGFAEHPNYTHNKMDVIAWGILLGILESAFPDFIKKYGGKHIFLFLGLFTLILTLAFHQSFEKSFFHIFWLNALSPFCYFLILLGLLYKKMPIFLNPLRYLAYFNYNLYLWHFILILPFTQYWGTGYLGGFLYLLCSIFLAIFFTFLVEEPMLKMRERFLKEY